MSNLQKITILKEGNTWRITREREKTGESGIFNNLEDAFNYVRALYDENGEEKETNEAAESARYDGDSTSSN